MLLNLKKFNNLLNDRTIFETITISCLNPANFNTLSDAGFDLNLIDYWAFDSIFLAKLVDRMVPNEKIDRLSFDNTSLFKLLCLNS